MLFYTSSMVKIVAATVVIFVILFVGVFIATGYQKKLFNSPNKVLTQPTLESNVKATAVETKEVHSSDGTMNLIARGDSFYAASISGEGERLIFVAPVGMTGKIVIPENSWSPDNKYIFLSVLGPDSKTINWLVLKATGEAFSNGEKYIEIAPLFTQKIQKYSLKDVTGWDSPTLLHLHTTGSSFWFDVTSKSIIQLANR